MADDQSTVLARELGKLGGVGAKWMARLLRTVDHESSLELQGSEEDVTRRVRDLVSQLGSEIPEFQSHPEVGKYSFLMGGGAAGLNPTIVHLRVEPAGSQTRVMIRAAAKEGLVKQQTARGVVDRVKRLLAGMTPDAPLGRGPDR